MTGVVNISGLMEFFVLQNTRTTLIMNLAKTISDGIYKPANAFTGFGKITKMTEFINK